MKDEKIYCVGPFTCDQVTYVDKTYLFSWDEISGNDDDRIIEILKDKLKIEWAKTENISKIDDGKTIIVSNKEKSLSLKLNDEKTKVNLKIDDGRVDEFTVKTENGKLNIYDKTLSIPDYLKELGYNVIIEPHEAHIEKVKYIREHIKNLKESSILIIDATESCGFNVPWDIGYLHAAITKKNKHKKLIVLKIGFFENEINRWRMDHSLEDLKKLFDVEEITDIKKLPIIARSLDSKTHKVSIGLLDGILTSLTSLKNYTPIEFGE